MRLNVEKSLEKGKKKYTRRKFLIVIRAYVNIVAVRSKRNSYSLHPTFVHVVEKRKTINVERSHTMA